MRSRRLVPALIGIVFALAGCGKRDAAFPFPTRDIPATKDEKGWPLYEQPADGFALALPPDWVALNLEAGALDKAVDQGLRANPDFEALGQQIRQQVKAGMKFMGIDKAGVGTGFATNVNVMKGPLDGASLEDAVDQAVGQLTSMPSIEKPIARERVTLRAGEGLRLRYLLNVTKPNGQRERAAITQYLVAVGKDIYGLTFTSLAAQEEQVRSTFETIAQSFRLLK
jgi:hypothetical protein